ncbi:hypothetical protein B0H11DRAFT_2292180 [Mycena galericulata]|nr:hypothetical protein B0H11DRAFT_2292180 [Mycena galericulata]
MKISTLDFGTFHMYPGSWGESNTVPWRQQWITDHATVNLVQQARHYGGIRCHQRLNQERHIRRLPFILQTDRHLNKQAGADLANGPTANDGYAIFPTDPVYELMQTHAAALEARG